MPQAYAHHTGLNSLAIIYSGKRFHFIPELQTCLLSARKHHLCDIIYTIKGTKLISPAPLLADTAYLAISNKLTSVFMMLREMEFGLYDGREDGKHNDAGFVEISKTFVRQDAFSWQSIHVSYFSH